ncbi:IK [Lepeophtheirus salmonis]|uniref:IK n=1 Tax=Lepeophtheirus salmonis TaxID=72036 RepID=A0A7R8HBI8_LEPSM|nr:IK [Lepeophtheirus salmonis]CAF2982044.1 IK [Lepeophtheirus salmonis]
MPEHREAHDFNIPEPPSSRLTNEDFRKLMMTPRASGSSSCATPSSSTSARKREKVPSEVSERRKKKKSYYAKLKKAEDDKMAELAAKYRDRAAERRDGGTNPNAQAATTANTNTDETPSNTASSGYRAVAPDVKSSYDAAERRRQMIQESKFLGGDMEHTHLVKGLDFALLQKVRSEIVNREIETEEVVQPEDDEEEVEENEEKKETTGDPITDLIHTCKTSMAKGLCRNLFKPEVPERNDFFIPGRMAYIIDLEEEFAESDIPTTSIRSKVDCQANVDQQTTLSTNDIVINKLTQILSYLRAGSRNKKKKKDRLKEEKMAIESGKKGLNEDIYQDIGEYDPQVKNDNRRDHYREKVKDRKEDRKSNRYKDDKRHSSRWDDRERKPRNYFDKTEKEEKEPEEGFSKNDKEFISNLIKKENDKAAREATKNLDLMSKKEPEGYAECYPGLMEMNDAIDDSDDEVDYSKMDLGNKKRSCWSMGF